MKIDKYKMGKPASMNEPQAPDAIPDHEVESAAHDLMRAEKHKSNKKLMKKVHKHLAGQKKAISSIQDLREMRNEMAKGEMENGAEDDETPATPSKSKY